MNIVREPYLFSPQQIAIIEEKYNARWLLSTEKNDINVEIFWTDVKHPEGSNYFGMYYNNYQLMITDGIFVEDQEFSCIEEDGKIYYSRYRHDYVMTPNGFIIDGGRAYTRSSISTDTFRVKNGEFFLVESVL